MYILKLSKTTKGSLWSSTRHDLCHVFHNLLPDLCVLDNDVEPALWNNCMKVRGKMEESVLEIMDIHKHWEYTEDMWESAQKEFHFHLHVGVFGP